MIPFNYRDFHTWESSQLLGRGVVCMSWFLITYLIFLHSAVPQLCAAGPGWDGAQQQSWPLVWQIACRQFDTQTSASYLNGVEGLPSVFKQLSAAASTCHTRADGAQPAAGPLLSLVVCGVVQFSLYVAAKLARLMFSIMQVGHARSHCLLLLIVVPSVTMKLLSTLLAPLAISCLIKCRAVYTHSEAVRYAAYSVSLAWHAGLGPRCRLGVAPPRPGSHSSGAHKGAAGSGADASVTLHQHHCALQQSAKRLPGTMEAQPPPRLPQCC